MDVRKRVIIFEDNKVQVDIVNCYEDDIRDFLNTTL